MKVSYLRRSRRPNTAFVLGGGGNLGAIQVGMLQAVFEREITPDVIVGCSVGAVNGCALAAEPTVDGANRLVDVWRDLDGETLCPSGRLSGIRLLTRKAPSMTGNEGLRHLIESSIGYRLFEDAAVPFQVVATSLRTGRERWFAEGPIVEPVLASAALPAVFPPGEIDGELFIDGGVVDNVPIRRAVELGARRIYVFHVGNFTKDRPDPKRPIDVLLQAFSIARSYRYLADVESVPEEVELVTLPGVDPGGLRYNDFRRSRELVTRGYESTATFLDCLGAAAGS